MASSRLDDDNGVDSGSAYLFDASTGEQLFKLLPNDGAEGDEFGYSIAIDNNAVVVGSYLDDDNGSDSGSVYLFDASTGVQINKILPSDGMEGDEFGWSVAIDSGIVAAGGYRDDDNGEDSGSAYLFDASTGTQLYKLLPSNGKNGDLFSQSIHIHRRIVVVGVWGDDDNGINAGSAYLFDAVSTPCTPDITGDGVLDFFDVSAFLDAFANLNPIADFNRDGDFNFFDVSAFLQAFAAGCP